MPKLYHQVFIQSEFERQCFSSVEIQIFAFIISHRCDGADFHLTKSHKKVLKNFNSFLQNGKDVSRRDSGSGSSNSSNSGCSSESGAGEKNLNVEKTTEDSSTEPSASEEIKMITSNPKVQIDIENALKLIANSENHLNVDLNNNVETTIPNVSIQMQSHVMKSQINDDNSKMREIAEKSKPHIDAAVNANETETKTQQLKAKLLRQQRKAEKQMAKVNSTTLASTSVDLEQRVWMKKGPKNTEKTLKALIAEMPNNGERKLKVCV